MFGRLMLPLTRNLNYNVNCQTRYFSLTCAVLGGGKSRRRRGIAIDQLSFGPLTDLPDWTYVDECKPPVVTKRQQIRQMKRVQMGTQITKLLREVDEQKARFKDGN